MSHKYKQFIELALCSEIPRKHEITLILGNWIWRRENFLRLIGLVIIIDTEDISLSKVKTRKRFPVVEFLQKYVAMSRWHATTWMINLYTTLVSSTEKHTFTSNRFFNVPVIRGKSAFLKFLRVTRRHEIFSVHFSILFRRKRCFGGIIRYPECFQGFNAVKNVSELVATRICTPVSLKDAN